MLLTHLFIDLKLPKAFPSRVLNFTHPSLHPKRGFSLRNTILRDVLRRIHPAAACRMSLFELP